MTCTCTVDNAVYINSNRINNCGFRYTVGDRYNAVQYNKILHTSLQWRGQNINQRLNLQKTHHITSELWCVFRENFGENWPRYNGTALYSTRYIVHILLTIICICLRFFILYHNFTAFRNYFFGNSFDSCYKTIPELVTRIHIIFSSLGQNNRFSFA